MTSKLIIALSVIDFHQLLNLKHNEPNALINGYSLDKCLSTDDIFVVEEKNWERKVKITNIDYVKKEFEIEDLSLTKSTKVKTLDLLNNGLINRRLNGDFEHFIINDLSDVSIEVETGRNYRLHESEIKNIIIQQIEDLQNEIKEFIG